MGLGSALDVTLAKAREKATEVRQQALDGRDPRIVRQKASEENPHVSFGRFAQRYVADIESGFRNAKHRQQWRNTLETYGKPIAKIPIAEVDTNDVLRCVRPIWGKKQETASRVRGRIEKVLDAAKAKGLRTGENPARMRGHLEHLLPKRRKVAVKHHAALPYAEMPAFMVALRKRQGVAAKALEFAILTAARSGEVRGMTWDEVDLAARLWTVPAGRMKASEEHVVPLSEPAVSVLQAVYEKGVSADDVAFPGPSGRALSDMTLSAILKRMGRDVTVHGMRSAFRDWAGDTTEFTREVVEMALAHAVGSATERAYRRGRAIEKRRELMDAWAAYCGTA